MKTTNSFQNTPFYQKNGGFTLLELMVVLLIFSLLATFTVPRLTSLYQSIQTAYEREEVLAQLSGLSFSVFQQNRAFDLVSYPLVTTTKNQSNTPIPLELPTGWQIRAEQPIHFFATGA